jgi:carboxypeptidase PM20D1
MNPWLHLLWIPVVMLIVITYKTIRFKPINHPTMRKKHEIDEKHAIHSLSEMIQFKTVSNDNPDLIDPLEFRRFKDYLLSRFPHVSKHAIVQEISTGILFKITGKSDLEPTVFMAHFDVVPASGTWNEYPFSGRMNASTVYGRGALDTKSSLNAIMEALEHALSHGKAFKNDLYLAFSGDEETLGHGAPAIMNELKKMDVKPALVLDEGGAIVSKMFPGVKSKAAVVGIAEKGFLNIRLVAKSSGGHASTPPKDTPVTLLSKAVVKLNQSKIFKLKMTTPVRELFKALAPHSTSLPIKVLFANLWLFLPVVKLIAKLSGGEFLSMFKTTQAFTLASGSEAINVLPAVATIGINYRLRPDESSDEVVRNIKKVIQNDLIAVEVLSKSEATKSSLIDESFDLIEKAIHQTWPDVLVAPYLMVATTDSRHYHEISDHVYKFSPMDVSKLDLKKIHGVDEDISIENIVNGVNFYLNLIEYL